MDAAATGATAAEPWSARLGPAATCAAAMAVPLAYLPKLDAVFTAPKLALLLVAGALGVGSEAWLVARGARRVRWPTGLAVALGAVLATTILSAGAAWARGGPGAPYAAAELARLIAVSGIALGAAQAASSPSWRRLLFRSIHAAAGVVSAIGLLQHLQILPFAIPIISVPGSTFGNRNIAAEAVATSIPFGLGLLGLERRGGRDTIGAAPRRSRTGPPALVLALLVLEVVYLAVTRTRGAWLGGVVGAAVFFALGRPGLGTPRSALLVVLGLVVAAIVAAVVPGRLTARDASDVKRYEPGQRVVLDAIDPTAPVARTRLGLWRRTWALARRHPIVGVGPGNFAVMFPLVAEPGARAEGVLTSAVVPRRAHNDLLERLCETGSLGLGALLALYVAAARVAARRVRGARDERRGEGVSSDETDVHNDIAAVAAGAASLTAVIACGMTGFPLAMPATALLFGVSIGVLAAQPTASTPTAPPLSTGLPRPGRPWPASAAAAIALAAFVAALVMSKRSLAGSFWLARAEASLRDPRPEVGRPRALEALARAAHASPGQFRVALFASRIATRAGQGEAAARWASEALAIEPFSPHAWTARADAELVVGDAGAAAAAATRALTLLHDYPEVLATWARAAARLGDRDAEREARARLTALAAADGPGASPPADKAGADVLGASNLAKEARSVLDALGPASPPSPGAVDAGHE